MPLLPQKSNSAENSAKMEDRTPIPAGDYLMHIVKTEFKETKKKNGHYLSVHFKVLEGEFTGRMVFGLLNLDNPNPVAVEIANKEANSISEALGLSDVEDSDEWLQIPLTCTVAIEPGDSQYPPQNKITAYAEADAIAPVADTPANAEPDPAADTPAAGTPAEAPGEKKLPWE